MKIVSASRRGALTVLMDSIVVLLDHLRSARWTSSDQGAFLSQVSVSFRLPTIASVEHCTVLISGNVADFHRHGSMETRPIEVVPPEG